VCVGQAVADRLRAGALEDAVAAVVGGERDLFVGVLFRGREASWCGVAGADVSEDAGRGHLREVDVDAEQPVGCLAYRGRDRGTPVLARISQAFHQHRPRACDSLGAPAGGGRLGGSGEVARVDDVELARGTRQGFPQMREITRNAILVP
jgi:hypothetical protein